jgi:hypothetical protein
MIDMTIKQVFFDKPKVVRAVDRAKRQSLSKAGAEIRKTAKRSMEASKKSGLLKESELPEALRKRRKTANRIRREKGQPRLKRLHISSSPGHPPAAGRSSPLNKRLFFGYDRSTGSVVVGPVGFRNSKVPRVLEYGGTTVITRRVKGKLVRKRVRIAPRPYMWPAFEKNKDLLPRVWQNSVRA